MKRVPRVSPWPNVALAALFLVVWPPSLPGQGLDAQLKPVVDEIVSGCTEAGTKRIAVADLTDLQGQSTELGRYIAEELGVSLVMAKPKFGLVDRANLRTILAEHKLTMSGLVNPETAKKLGQIAGVDAIVTGTITPLGDNYRLTIKVVATDTASIMAAARSDIARTPAIIAVADRGVQGPTAGAAGGPSSPPSPEAAAGGRSSASPATATVPPSGQMSEGKAIFERAKPACGQCHTIAKNSLARTGAENTIEELRAWIRTPKDMIRTKMKKGIMPAYGRDRISDREIEALVAYLATMR